MATKGKKVDLSNYTKGEYIGRGAFGYVHVCTNKKTKRRYAAKISILGSKDVEKQFSREIETLSHVNHPCVIKLEGYSLKNFEGDSVPVILTDYMMGGSLKDAIEAEYKNKPIKNWNNTRKQIILFGMAAGIKALHDNNIIHRDFKPDNVLLDGSLNPHIIDFGLAKILDPESSINMSMHGGTAAYMAPELIEETDFSYPVDIFAFGISAYELICGKPAYEKKCPVGKILKSAASGVKPKFNHKCPGAFEELINSCWDHSPENRLTAQALYDEIMTNENLILPDINIDEFRSYCETFLKKEPKCIQALKTGKNRRIHVPKGITRSTRDVLSKTQTPTSMNSVPTVSPKMPKVPKVRPKPKPKSEEEPEEKPRKSSEKKKSKEEEEPTLTTGDSFDKFSKTMNPGLLKRFSDKSFMNSINETMKSAFKKDDDDTLSTTINATKTDDLSLSTSKSAKRIDVSKIKIIDKPHPDMSADLLFLLGNIFESGLHGKGMNFNKAAAFYKAAAEKGHVDAMFNYGNFLRDGVGVDEDAEEAVKYLTKAAKGGCIEATINLGRMIEEGEGCEKNPAKALSWYEKGAKGGQTLGYSNAGRLCLLGDSEYGLKPDLKKAEKYLTEACKKDDCGIGPKVLLSILYFMTDQYEKGIPYAKMAADEDIPPAQFIYGLMLIKKNPKEAAVYFEKAANNGFDKATFILGNMYYNGDGVEKSYEKAAEWFRASAESGDSDGCLRYGMCLIEGEGVDEDDEEGARYLRKSCEDGNQRAMAALVLTGLILKKVTLTDDDEEYILKGLVVISSIKT